MIPLNNLPGVMRGVVEGGGARSAGKRTAPSLTMVSADWRGTERGEAGPAVMTRSSRLRVCWGSRARSGSLGSSGPRSRAARAEGVGPVPRPYSTPPLLRPADRLAWWDGVSHVVTRPLCLDHLNAVGPLTFRWTTWFTKYGGPTAHKWSNRTQVVQPHASGPTARKWSKQESAAMNPPAAPRELPSH